ncbi:CGNR zinc finger domain-containing protein [Granulicella sp. dw_53]|uniref:CGNR zinc finger domain-containing protein n=1 Tax=Granulicella sp. dw_53 TaxID=2719792 RepID=UPI001BD66EE0|nr:CGNR zinc finger domain-containing protein [Granulicella sp. dw_53]
MSSHGQKQKEAPPPVDVDLVAGHAAVSFINTLRNDAGVPVEHLLSDKDVHSWMRKMEIPEPNLRKELAIGALLRTAKALRSIALEAVQQKKSGKRVDLTALNGFLARSESHLEMRQQKKAIEVNRAYFANSAEQFLAPTAEAISDLLANGNFELIRQCEGTGCGLWFLDRTNGRARRYCIEEACGTRMRVAAYRAKQAKREETTAGLTQ